MTVTANKARRIALLGTVVAGLALVLSQVYAQSAGNLVPGDAKAGIRVFFDKGCARCHAVLGEGGRTAPDLARAPAAHLSAAELVADMWNHAPAMWEKMRFERVTPTTFTETEMADLFAFLYSARSLDRPGNAERGRRLLSEKRCLRCHAVGGEGRRVGPDLEKWASARNPVSWIQAMWNHGPAMQQIMQAEGLPWPEFRGDDAADIVAYIRTVAQRPRQTTYLQPADPEAGRRVFRQKGCIQCHAIHRAGGKTGPDLASRQLPPTLGQFAADMWNHGPAMWAAMTPEEQRQRRFTKTEMADLLAYLLAERYFEPPGSVARGQKVYVAKGCSGCHGGPEAAAIAPQLMRHAAHSPTAFAAAWWNHGPMMLQTMEQQEVPWPVFRPGEIGDLLEFLRQSAAARPEAQR
jgi:cytochrome c2